MKKNSDSRKRNSARSNSTAKTPMREGRSGKPGSPGGSSGKSGGGSREAMRAGAGSHKSKSSRAAFDSDGGEPSAQAEMAGLKDESGLV